MEGQDIITINTQDSTVDEINYEESIEEVFAFCY